VASVGVSPGWVRRWRLVTRSREGSVESASLFEVVVASLAGAKAVPAVSHGAGISDVFQVAGPLAMLEELWHGVLCKVGP
jgi:hypothetical protein